MLATERHPKGQPTTEKLPAELLATEQPGVVAHDVLCLVAYEEQRRGTATEHSILQTKCKTTMRRLCPAACESVHVAIHVARD